MSDYKPGSFAVVTFRADDMRKAETLPGIRWASGWAIVDACGNYELIVDRIVSEVRPLLVLDPDDVEQVKTLRDWLGHLNYYGTIGQLQSSLRQMTRPPKPPEPQGLGAVVEDSEGRLWVRVCGTTIARSWQDNDRGANERYHEIDVVRVHTNGWEPKP